MPQADWLDFEVELMDKAIWVWPMSFGVPITLGWLEDHIPIPAMSGWVGSLKDKFNHWFPRWRDGIKANLAGQSATNGAHYIDLLRAEAEAAFAAAKSEQSWTEGDLDEFLAGFPPPYPSEEE